MLNRSGQVGQTPYQGYGGELTAGINPQQTQGINAINAAGNYSSPYVQQALSYANQAAGPVTAQQIQQYQNPYTQQVVDATQAQFAADNQRQFQSIRGNAASIGALGGDREAVAEGEAARQQNLAQNPVLANLYSQSYSSALGAAQADKARQAAAAGQIGGLGFQGQNAAMQAAQAQFGAGTAQQQTQQMADQAAYQQWAQQQAYPYQQLGWQAGIQTGVGSQMGSTGTATGTETKPAPNPLNSILGGGLALAGIASGAGGFGKLFSANGGRIPYAGGGEVQSSPYGDAGFIPHIAIARGAMMQQPRATLSRDDPQDQSKPLDYSGFSKIGGLLKSGPTNINPLGGYEPAQEGYTMASGAGDPAGALPALRAHGGGIYIPHMAGGGTPQQYLDRGFDALSPQRIYSPDESNPEDGFPLMPPPQANPNDITMDGPGPQQVDPAAYRAWQKTVDADRGLGMVATDTAPGASAVAARGIPMADDNPPGVLAYGPGARRPAHPLAGIGNIADPSKANYLDAQADQPYDDADLPPSATAVQDQSGKLPGIGGGGFSQFSVPLIAAGLGMMSSRSPYLGEAIGQGGLQGLGAYVGQRNADEKHALDVRKADQEAARLAEAAKLARDTLNETTQTHRNTEARLADKTEFGWRQKPDGTLEYVPGGPHDPVNIKAQAEAKTPALMTPEQLTQMGWSPETIKAAATNYNLKGEMPKNLGTRQYAGAISGAINAEATRQVHEDAVKRGISDDEALADRNKKQQVFKSEQLAINRFMSGEKGDKIRSLGVVVDHLGTMRQLLMALKNTDYPLANQIYNTWAKATGKPEVTNAALGAQIVGIEVMKALVASGAGGVEERRDLAKAFNPGSSPAQALGAIDTVARPLLAGQLSGFRRQFVNSTGLPESKFYQGFSEEGKQFLTGGSGGGGSGGDSVASPPVSLLKEGHVTTFGNGQKWKLTNGKPEQVK